MFLYWKLTFTRPSTAFVCEYIEAAIGGKPFFALRQIFAGG